MISSVPPADVGKVWGQISPMIQDALQHGQGDGMAVDAVLLELAKGTRSLWLIHDGDPEAGGFEIKAAVVTSLSEVPGRGHKIYVDLLAGRRMGEWVQELQDALNQAAELTGAFCIEASCRRGLAKYLQQNMGWKVKAIIMEAPK